MSYINLNDRVFYLDSKHRFHNFCESFFDWGLHQRRYQVVVETGMMQLPNGNRRPVSYVQSLASQGPIFWKTLGKALSCLLIFPPIIFGIGLLICRSKHQYLISSLATPQEAFLQSPGFKREGRDKYITWRMRNEGENQGTKATRALAAKLPFETFSLESLRKLEPSNPELICTLRVKWLAHTHCLQGLATINRQSVDLEGFSEEFALPMAFNSLRAFWKEQSFFDQEDQEWIETALKNALTHRGASDEDYAKAEKRIEEGDVKFPQVIASGRDWHINYGIFTGTEFISSNRPGINIYQVRGKITQEQLKRAVNRELYCSPQQGTDAFRLKPRHLYPIKDQSVGNCGYANIKALLFVLMALRIKLKNKDEGHDWDTCFNRIVPIFQQWKAFDKLMLAEDFIVDLENSKKDSSLKPMVNDLKMIFQAKVNRKGRLFKSEHLSNQAQKDRYAQLINFFAAKRVA